MVLDLQSLFSKGFSVTKLDNIDYLLQSIKNDVFDNHSGIYSNNAPPKVVNWSYTENVPNLIKNFWSGLAADSYFNLFRLNYGEFTHLKMSAHKYEKNHELLWHHDFHEACPINNILYLSDTEVLEDHGSLLKIGKWKIDRNGWGKSNEVEILDTVIPHHGTLVTLMNFNPTFCHSVTPFLENYGRYSLICRMGYMENIENSKISKFM
jgi:hypothetical protein